MTIALIVLGTCLVFLVIMAAVILMGTPRDTPEQARDVQAFYRRTPEDMEAAYTSDTGRPILWSGLSLCVHDKLPTGRFTYICTRCGAVGMERRATA